MKNWSAPFNTYLLALLLGTACGCQTDEANQKDPSKQMSTLRLHMEASPGNNTPSIEVPVFRARPISVLVEKEPFISENNVLKAAVVDDMGGFAINIQLDRKGRWLLEKYTASNRGRRMAIFSNFGDARWLAAPQIQRLVNDGRVVFVPDASLEEAQRIVRGLNNVARKLDTTDRF